jgi:hypothetical protein
VASNNFNKLEMLCLNAIFCVSEKSAKHRLS